MDALTFLVHTKQLKIIAYELKKGSESMPPVNLTIATWDYDRVGPSWTGGSKWRERKSILSMSRRRNVFTAHEYQEFDVTEIGLSGYVAAISRAEKCVPYGISPYIAVPLFHRAVSGVRAFTFGPIEGSRRDGFEGKKIGVPEYQITAAVWSRGYLHDEYGLNVEDMKWVQGGMDDPGGWTNGQQFPPGFPITYLGDEGTLNEMFEKGELDALICPRTPRCYRDGKTPVAAV